MSNIYDAPYLDEAEHAVLDHTGVPGVGGQSGATIPNYRGVKVSAGSANNSPWVLMPTDLAVAFGTTEAGGFVTMPASTVVSVELAAGSADEAETTVAYVFFKIVKIADATGVIASGGVEFIREQNTPGAAVVFDADSADDANYVATGDTSVTVTNAGTYQVFLEVDFSA